MALRRGTSTLALSCRCPALLSSPKRFYYHPRQHMPSERLQGPLQAGEIIDLRSDVLTKPTERMKEAMKEATAGDDVFNEDHCVHELQDKVADLFGKERALFVPSGTMGNLISVLEHCSYARGLEVLMGDKSHIHLYEQGGLATLGGVHPRTFPNLPDGTCDLDLLEEYIRPRDDPHQPWTALVTVENTHNNCGGRFIPLDFIKKLRRKADAHGLKLHMDGARLMNAVVASRCSPAEILHDMDSVSMCFSKGIGCPIGSVIAGTSPFIDSAIRLRKALGGGWRQPGLLAAAALVALEDVVPRMERDHAHAKELAIAIKENGNGVVDVDLEGVQTNIVMVNILKPGLTAAQFCERLEVVTDQEEKDQGERVIIEAGAVYDYTVKLCTYHNITDKHMESVKAKLLYVLAEYADVPYTRSEVLQHKKTVQLRQKQDWFAAAMPRGASCESLLYDLAYRK